MTNILGMFEIQSKLCIIIKRKTKFCIIYYSLLNLVCELEKIVTKLILNSSNKSLNYQCDIVGYLIECLLK